MNCCSTYFKLQQLRASGLELLSSLCRVCGGAVMGQVSFFVRGQICSRRSRRLKSQCWPWAPAFTCLVWRGLDLALPWLQRGTKSPLEKPPATMYNTPGWLLLQGSGHLLGVTWVLLTPRSTSPLHSRLPGAIGDGAATYQLCFLCTRG